MHCIFLLSDASHGEIYQIQGFCTFPVLMGTSIYIHERFRLLSQLGFRTFIVLLHILIYHSFFFEVLLPLFKDFSWLWFFNSWYFRSSRHQGCGFLEKVPTVSFDLVFICEDSLKLGIHHLIKETWLVYSHVWVFISRLVFRCFEIRKPFILCHKHPWEVFRPTLII